MKREIKFRGKAKDGEWVHGDLTTGDTIHTSPSWHEDGEGGMVGQECHEETIGQFTGLKDKNGVEIYEGDIIIEETDYDLLRFEVKWNKDTLMWDAISQVIVDEPLYYKNGFIEIIGNIHDNPELIKDKNETSLNHENPPITNVLLGESAFRKAKRQLAYVGHFSGAYQSMCRKNPIRDLHDKSGFVVVSTDRNYDDTVVTMSNLKQSQKDLLKEWNVL